MEPTCAEDETTTSCEEATAEFCGSLVRLDCGNEGVYQGIVLEVDPTNAHIQIERPFRNGVSLDNQVIQIPGELIKEVLVVHTLPNAISTSTKNSYATSTSTKNLLPNSTKSKQTTTSPKLKSRDQPTKKEQPINKREQPLIKREQTINKREQPINKREQSTNKREQPINKREQPTTKREQPTKTNEQPTCKRDISKKKREPLVDQTQQKTDKLRIKTLKQTTNHRKLKSKEQQTNKRNSAIKKDEAQLVEEIQQKTDKMSIKEKEEPPQGVSEETASPISNEEGKTRFIGCLASVYLTNTPDIYQGKILSVDAEEHSVRLEKPILNGRPLSIPFIDISGKMMKDIRVVRGPSPVRSHENRPSSAVNKAEENFESFMLQATCIQHEDGRRQQQLPDNRTPPSDISESAADCESNHLAPSNYNSSDTLSGDEEFHSDESSDEYNGPRTFDQRHNKQQLPTLNQRNEVENLEEMKVATPSSAYVIHYCASPVEAKEQSASNTDKTPRQRRITCAERMLMINQRQQTNDGSSVRSGTPTYANRNRPVTPLTPRSSSVQSNAQIYMQSSCKVGRGMTASIPTGNNESRFGNSRSNSFNNQNPCKTANVPGSVRIMQKLFSPTKSEQREFNMAPSQHQCVTGQRIDVNDLLRGCASNGAPLFSERSSEPPAMSRPGSSAGSLNREAFTSMKSPLRRPLSAVVLAPMNAGAANFRVLHNRSPIIATGRHSMGSMPSHRRPSPADSVRSEHFKRFSPPNASSPPATVTRAQFAHQAFGEFKLFKGQQQAIPMRLQVNYRRNIHGEYGPTGIPAVDCSNGYRSYSDRYAEAIMGDPLDPNLETDFDFAGNLALFDKAEFNRETEHIFQGLDSACDSSRNYRNDENVLQDSSRVISWTKSTAVADDDDNQNTSTSSPVD